VLDQLAAAQDSFQQAVQMKEQTLGPEHPSTARSYGNLGNCYRRRGDLAQAARFLLRALAILQQAEPESGTTAYFHDCLGQVYRDRGETDLALAEFQRAHALFEKLGEEARASPLLHAGQTYLGRRELPRAEDRLVRALQVLEAQGPEEVDRRDLGEARFALAQVRWALGRSPGAARSLAEQARLDLESATGDARALVTEVRAWLAAHR
jgi:tetratricopeptide (TPR) repeat protein